MAENIYLKTGELSSGLLKNATGNLRSAKETLGRLDNHGSLGTERYVGPSGDSLLLFTPEIAAEVGSIVVQLEDLLEKLEKCASVLNTGPDALEEIDSNCKNDLTGWWERTTYRLDNSFSGLFHSGKKTDGDQDLNSGFGDDDSNWPEYVTEEKLEVINGYDPQWGQEHREEIEKLAQSYIGVTGFAAAMENLYRNTNRTEIIVNDYKDGVKRGTIRYIDQNGGYYGDLYENGWGSQTYQAGRECGTACESMCMSYLGIDATPKKILTSRGGFDLGTSNHVAGLEGEPVAQVSTPSGGWDYEDIGKKIDAFMDDAGQGNISPVLVRYAAEHAVMILDRTINEDGSWVCTVLGPSNYLYGTVREHDKVTVTISPDGIITGNLANIGGGSSKITQCVQYYRTDAI